MGYTWGKLVLVLGGVLMLAVAGYAQSVSSLYPYLQAERNEIALLTAQQSYLLQQGDTVGGVLVASYIPDHQMQAAMLSDQIRGRGGNPDTIVAATPAPVTGTRAQILMMDLQQHQQAANTYAALADRATRSEVKFVAANGLVSANRHFDSLNVAWGSLYGTPTSVASSLLSALRLERTTVADLQVQADQLRSLGDPAMADRLMSLVPAHQAQIARLESTITQMGFRTDTVAALSPVALPSRDLIFAHLRSVDIQLANTYAQPIALLPGTPIAMTSLLGQQNAITSVAVLLGGVQAV